MFLATIASVGSEASTRHRRSRDAYVFLALACGITWTLDVPYVLACLRGVEPPSYAMPLIGLGALGPSLAALLLAGRRGELREVFGGWRVHPGWVVAALLLPAALHLPGTAIEAALGGQPQWLYPPVEAEHVAALIMFSLGEEFGWRGYAHPRLTARHGPTLGTLIVGVVWALWHFGMWFTPEHGAPQPALTALGAADLVLWAFVIAWLFERSNRSMAVALAVHAGGHLDNIHRIPETDIRLRMLHLLVLAIVAACAARGLVRMRSERAEA